MKFTKPDQQTIARMTPLSLESFLSTLRERRAAAVQPFDRQIRYYELILEYKQMENPPATFDEFLEQWKANRKANLKNDRPKMVDLSKAAAEDLRHA